MGSTNKTVSEIFPVYTDIPSKISLKFWRTIQTAGVLIVLALTYVLIFYPETGLFVLWKIAVPLLPFVFVFMPGLWRNSCPLVVINQIPRIFGFSRELNPPKLIKDYGYLIAVSILLILVTSRKILFNAYGEATAVLILVVALIAFFGGLFYKGKSGFCSSICPVFPVERIYGQSPLIIIPNVHCSHCIGCTKNCYDYNPSAAYLADQYDESKFHSSLRRFFASIFPGFVLSYFLITEPPANSVPMMIAEMLMITAASSIIFYLLNAVFKTSANKFPSVFGITAFTVYYWFTIPVLAGSFTKLAEVQVPIEVIFGLRFIVIIFSLYWLYRTIHIEKKFISNVIDAGVSVKTLFGYTENKIIANN